MNRGRTHGTIPEDDYHTGSDSSDEQLSPAQATINLERRDLELVVDQIMSASILNDDDGYSSPEESYSPR